MDAVTLLADAQKAGLRFDVVGGQLRIEASKSQRHWLDRLQPHRDANVQLLAPDDTGADPPEAELRSVDQRGVYPVMIPLGEVQPEPVCWLWQGRVAIGKLTLIAGDPGLGKSFLTLDIAARVSRGDGWPDGHPGGDPGGVVLLNCEDDLGDTIRPRLDAAGADVSRIEALSAISGCDDGEQYQRSFDLSRDLHHLERAIENVDACRLVIVDPVSAYLGGTDSHRNAEIRGLLGPLSEMASRLKVAVVAVTHLRKGEGAAIYRAMGSLAFAAAARAVWAVAKCKDDPRRRLFVPIKNNLADDVSGLAYTVESNGDDQPASVSWFAGEVTTNADEALAAPRATGSAVKEAADWLQEALSAGAVPAQQVMDDGTGNGHSAASLRKALKTLKGRSRKSSMGGGWVWELGDDPDPTDRPADDPDGDWGEVA